MHFLFMQEMFSQYDVKIRMHNNIERINIKNKHFEDEIIIDFYPDDYYTYMFRFATQHNDLTSKDDLLTSVLAFANAEKAAIEFYDNGVNRFGGEIKTSLLDNLTYDELRTLFGYPHRDISDLTFTVRAWDDRYCFNGYFQKRDSGDVDIMKE